MASEKRRDWGRELEDLMRKAIKDSPSLALGKRDPGVAGGQHSGGKVTGFKRSAGLDFEGYMRLDGLHPLPSQVEAKAVKGGRLPIANFKPGQLERLHQHHARGCLSAVLVATHDDQGFLGVWLASIAAFPNPKKLTGWSEIRSVVVGQGSSPEGHPYWLRLAGFKGVPDGASSDARTLFSEGASYSAMTLEKAAFALWQLHGKAGGWI